MKKKITLLCLLLLVLVNIQAVNAIDFTDFSEIIAPPANDECSTATELTVNADNLCTSITSGTVAEATESPEAVVCTGKEDEANDDVWFKFVATATTHKIDLLNVSGSTTNLYHAIYDGGMTGDCGALSLIFCSDPNSSEPTGLTVGNTYFVRVFTNSTGTHNTTFDICVGTDPALPPANDECSNAEVISSVPFSDSVDATNATNNSGFIDVATCGSMNDGVWYTIVGDGNQLTVNVLPTGWDVEVAVYSGSCGSFTCVGSSNLGISGTAEEVTFTSTLGVTYFINIGHHSGTIDESEGVFNINVTSTVLSIDDLIEKGFSYYPNPVRNDYLNLSANETIRFVAIYNYLGQQLRLFAPSELKTEINFSGLPNGAYFVKAYVGDNAAGIFKVIKE